MQNSKSRGFHVTAESLLSFPVGKTKEVSRSPDANSCLLQVVKVFSYRTSLSLLGTELHGTTLPRGFCPSLGPARAAERTGQWPCTQCSLGTRFLEEHLEGWAPRIPL